jgi:hypothetical protein
MNKSAAEGYSHMYIECCIEHNIAGTESSMGKLWFSLSETLVFQVREQGANCYMGRALHGT